MIVEEVSDRLKDIDPAVFRLVAGAAELASVKDAPPTAPAAYVFVESEAAGDNERITGVLQRVERDVAVVVVAKNASGTTGAAAYQDVEQLKVQAFAALIGWQPESAAEELTFVGSQLVRARNGHVWLQLTFSAPYYLESH